MDELLPYEAPAPRLSFSQAKDLLATSDPIPRELWCFEVFGGNHAISRAYGADR